MVSAGVTEFLSLLAILFGGGMISAWIMHKIRLPTIIGFILIGIIAGPFGLGLVKDTELINLLAEFGIIILLFVIGLEFSLKKLQKVGLTGVLVGTIQLAIVFSLGYVVALAFDWTHLEALFLGSILSITSTAISLRFLRDLKLVNTDEWNTVVIILIIEDLAAVLLLTILGDATKGDGFALTDFGLVIIQSIVFFVITFGVGIKIIPKLLEHVSKIKMEEALFISSLALVFGLSVLAHFLNLSSAVGAFLMGMIIASTKFSDPIISKVLPLRDFFLIMFFVSIGMLVNIALIPEVIWITIPIVIVAIIGKFIGNMFAASFAGNTLVSASTIGIVMIPIGEFSFIIAKLGTDSGAIRESIFPITVLVAIITMLMMPLILRALPTKADSKSIVPTRLLNTVFYVGMLLRGKPSDGKPDSASAVNVKKYAPLILVHIVVIVTILAAMNYFSPSIISLMNELEIPFLIAPEVFLVILTVTILIYPIVSFFGRTEKIISDICNKITINFDSKEKRKVDRPLYKVIRNSLFMGLMLLLVSIFISFVEFEDNTITIIISTVALIITLLLILDTIFAIKKLTQTHVFDSWMPTEKEND
ncbi:cation:proton antiporter [archaeon]|nr:cation:proton antiporter [archaeon]